LQQYTAHPRIGICCAIHQGTLRQRVAVTRAVQLPVCKRGHRCAGFAGTPTVNVIELPRRYEVVIKCALPAPRAGCAAAVGKGALCGESHMIGGVDELGCDTGLPRDFGGVARMDA
jgi:hypothetical protein